jgi:hypothetical protein
VSSELEFNFHDNVGLHIDTEDPRAIDFYTLEYGHHSGRVGDHLPGVRLHWQGSNFGRKRKSGAVPHTHKIFARWTYALFLDQDKITIHAAGNQFALPMVHHMLVHPSIRLLCSRRGTLLLHGSAVARNGGSVIFTGHGGTGKTTTSSILLSDDDLLWQVHADDYVFINPGEGTYAYLTRAHLYKDLLKIVPSVSKRLSLSEQIQIAIFGAIRELSRDQIKWPVRIPLERLWPERTFCETASLTAIVVLERSNKGSDVEIVPLEDDMIVDDLLSMNFYEARHFINLVAPFEGVSWPENWLDDWRENERDALTLIVNQSKIYKMRIPLDQKRARATEEGLRREISGL